ncbi:MAG: hypothetical protein GFH24_608346n28 [Chloroflexi bacterium AL-N5]|nr:hypothetical protein [Chloroflexi bacterium AL-N5]
MFWQVSKLILQIWRNKLRYLFQQYPVMWIIVFILPIFYILGSFLFHSAIYRVLIDMIAIGVFTDNVSQIIGFSSFSSFGLTTLLLITLAILLSPNNTSLSIILAPFPIKIHHQHIGILLPGLLFLLVAQISVWSPVFFAFIRSQLSSVYAVLGAIIFGLLCYTVITLTFYQLSVYIVTQVFGKEHHGLQSVSIPLVIIFGVILLIISMTLGVNTLVSGQSPLWLWLIPAFWMSLIFSGKNVILGLLLLISVTLFSTYLYVYFLKQNLRLFDGTKGRWIPLRQLPFGKPILQVCCTYEWKTAMRDQQLILGVALTIGLFIAAVGATLWIRRQVDLLSAQLIVQTAIYIGTLLLCFVAQMSWGRDSGYRRLMRIIPLDPRTFLVGKMIANIIGIIIIWASLTSVLMISGSQLSLFLETFKFVPLGILGAFLLGILVPYSLKDPLAMTFMIASVTLLGIPIQFLLQQSFFALQENISLPSDIETIIGWIIYIAAYAVFFVGIMWSDKTKQEKLRE